MVYRIVPQCSSLNSQSGPRSLSNTVWPRFGTLKSPIFAHEYGSENNVDTLSYVPASLAGDKNKNTVQSVKLTFHAPEKAK